MTQIQKIALNYSIALGMITCSFATWSTILLTQSSTEKIQASSDFDAVEDIKVFGAVKADRVFMKKSAFDNTDTEEFSMKESNPDFYPSEIDSWELKKKYALSVPSLGIHTPILVPSKKFWNMRQWEMLEEQMQVGMRSGAVAYPHSSAPGSLGALIVAGHSSPPNKQAAETRFGNIFERLPDISKGENMIVTHNGNTTVYEVTGAIVVPVTETSILEQNNDKSVLKLITCYPVGSTKDRMVITARKIDS